MGMPSTLLGHAENVKKGTDANLDLVRVSPSDNSCKEHQWNEVLAITNDIFRPNDRKYIKNNLVIMYPRNGEHIFCHSAGPFVISRLHCT